MPVELKPQAPAEDEVRIPPLVRRRNLSAEMQALHDRFVAPLKSAAHRMFSSEDGRKVLEALDRVFDDGTLPRDSNGAIDSNAVLINVGARRVLDYLRTLAEKTKKEGTG